MTKPTRNTLTVSLYGNKEREVSFPALWIICEVCEGHATDRGASVECDGGGFTASEWADQDDDFREGYLAGQYDQPCRACAALGRVQIIDRDAVRGRLALAYLRAYDEQQRDFAEVDAMQAAERRFGA